MSNPYSFCTESSFEFAIEVTRFVFVCLVISYTTMSLQVRYSLWDIGSICIQLSLLHHLIRVSWSARRATPVQFASRHHRRKMTIRSWMTSKRQICTSDEPLLRASLFHLFLWSWDFLLSLRIMFKYTYSRRWRLSRLKSDVVEYGCLPCA